MAKPWFWACDWLHSDVQIRIFSEYSCVQLYTMYTRSGFSFINISFHTYGTACMYCDHIIRTNDPSNSRDSVLTVMVLPFPHVLPASATFWRLLMEDTWRSVKVAAYFPNLLCHRFQSTVVLFRIHFTTLLEIHSKLWQKLYYYSHWKSDTCTIVRVYHFTSNNLQYRIMKYDLHVCLSMHCLICIKFIIHLILEIL